MRFSFLIPALVLLLAAQVACRAEERVLFDGTSLDGWAHTGPGYFELDPKEACLISRGGMGMLFYYDQKFDDFELTLEWNAISREANSGVFIRFPNLPKKDRPPDAKGRGIAGPWAAVHEGYEVQICDAAGPGNRTGSLYSFFDSTEVPTKEPGQWNEMKVRVVGQHYEVFVNGKKIGDYQGDRALSGYIGLQNHDPNSEVRYRNIRVKPLEKK